MRRRNAFFFIRPAPAFTLIETLATVSIAAIVIGLLAPALGEARREASRVVCAAEMRDIAFAVTLYAGDHDGSVPFAYQQTDEPGVWLAVDGETEIGPLYFQTAADYWAFPFLDDYGGTMLAEALLCPEDRVTGALAEDIAEHHGLEAVPRVVPLQRSISRSFYFNPFSLREDLEVVRAEDCRVARLGEVVFASRKALLVEQLPFHMRGFVGPEVPLAFTPSMLMVAAVDGTVGSRSQADAAPGVLVEPLPPHGGWAGDAAGWRGWLLQLAAFEFTRDGVRGVDW